MSLFDQASAQFSATQLYASSSFQLAAHYIDELNNYLINEIQMTPPSVTIDTHPTIVIDPSLIQALPIAPPDSEYPQDPSAPNTTDYTMPTSPSITYPSLPTLADITLPSFIPSSINGITTSLPTFTDDVPAVSGITDGGDANFDTLVEALRSKLQSFIIDGGTMLNPQVEADIWQRDLERIQQNLQDSVDKATGQWAKMGFDIPDGFLASMLIPLNVEYYNKLSDRSREIAVKQAELEQQGVFKSMEIATKLEEVIITSHHTYAQRAFDASKATAELTIKIFETRIAKFNALLETFKVDVDQWKTQIEGVLAQANIYKTQIEGLSLIEQINETKVKIYTSQLSAVATMVEVFKTQVQAVATEYEAEKVKIERYKSQVEAYVAAIDGITKKYGNTIEGYKAFIQAWVASSDSQTKLAEIGTKAQIAEVEAAIKEWEIEMRIIEEEIGLKQKALETVAQTASNLAAGALAAIHTSAQVSDSSSEQISTSTSTNYNYSY